MAQLRSVPRTLIYRLLRKGEVRVNGGRKKPEYRLQAQDEVRIPPLNLREPAPLNQPSARQSSDLREQILLEDQNFIAINKPEGWAVHGGSGISLGLIEALRQIYAEPNLELVHRLDRDTSGVLLIARRRRALRLAQAAFREHQVRKEYLVLVAGHWPASNTQVSYPLLRYLTPSGERRVRVDATGKRSQTGFRVLAQCPAATALIANPKTGRTHQIRVHCAHSGHPVTGDSKYAPDALLSTHKHLGVRRLGLHAQRLRLSLAERSHQGPGTALADLDLAAPAPQSLLDCWASLGGSAEIGRL